MRNVLIFIAGVVIGIVICFGGLVIGAERDFGKNLGIALFEQGEKTLSIRKLKVFQVIDKEGALVRGEEESRKIGQMPQTYLLLHDGQDLYYDNQEIQVSKGMEVKQIGVYRYKNREDMILTVPAIRIESIKTEKNKQK